MTHGALLTAEPDQPEQRPELPAWGDLIGKVDHSASQTETEVAHALVRALELRDEGMADHSRRVGRLSAVLGRHLGLSEDRCHRLELSGLLHDIGKIAFPDRLVDGELLGDDDRPAVEEHPLRGARLVRWLPGALSCVAKVVVQHHERLDGSGYPMGLSGSAICEDARIVAVADVFDAMTDPSRRWRPPVPRADALRELEGLAPRMFDPRVVGALPSAADSE
jgi:HD-GYP domain-containing protein (c-di-GMP phosphodiesterase class II)